MKDNQDTGDAWFEERFGRTPTRAGPRQRVLWYGGSLLMALALLVSFYIVLNQSVSRAQQHWAEASGSLRMSSTEGCASPRAREGCADGTLEPSRLRGSSQAGLAATGR